MDRTRTEEMVLRKQIMETARFLFQRQGFDRTTLQDISARLDLSEITVAAYFPSRDELLEAVWSE